MEDFHQVSSIIDADVLPKTCRRVKITKHGSDKPLGFYIRDGYSVRLTPNGLQKVPSIFISRVLPGGLAESTGLLAVNDEVLEVNGIDVLGKSIEQVTDMMIVNASNLILTIKPASQNHLNDSFISTRSTTTNSLPRNGVHQSPYQPSYQPTQRNLHYDLQNLQSDQMQMKSDASRQSGNIRQSNALHNSTAQSNVLQNNVQQNSLQSSNFTNQHAQQSHLHQYSSLRNNQSTNQKNLAQQLQHNNSFNYPKASLAANHHLQSHSSHQPNHLKQQENQFLQNLDHYNGFAKLSQPNVNQFSVNQSNQRTNQHQQNIYQNIRVNLNQINDYPEENNGAVGYDNHYENTASNNEDIIERLKRGYFGVEETNYDEDSDEQDEVVHHDDYIKNFDELKLRNVYQKSNNQGLNVN